MESKNEALFNRNLKTALTSVIIKKSLNCCKQTENWHETHWTSFHTRAHPVVALPGCPPAPPTRMSRPCTACAPPWPPMTPCPPSPLASTGTSSDRTTWVPSPLPDDATAPLHCKVRHRALPAELDIIVFVLSACIFVSRFQIVFKCVRQLVLHQLQRFQTDWKYIRPCRKLHWTVIRPIQRVSNWLNRNQTN